MKVIPTRIIIIFLVIFPIIVIGGILGDSLSSAIELRYLMFVDSHYYIDSYVHVDNGSISYTYMLILARNSSTDVIGIVDLRDLLANKTAACNIYGNSSAMLDVAIQGNRVNLSLIMVNPLLLCNVRPWFKVEGNISLSKIQYGSPDTSKQDFKVYIGYARKITLSTSLLLNDTSWSIFRKNSYVGDMIFLLRNAELYQNATLLLFRHSGGVGLKLSDKEYPTAIVAFINYTDHPLGLNKFNYDNISISPIDLCKADFSKPSIGIVKMINPSVDLLNHWRKMAHQYNLLLVDFHNNTYIVKNHVIEQAYSMVNDSRLWRLDYYLISESRIGDTEFYRYHPFIIINNTSYGIVPPTSNLTVIYDNINGILLSVNVSNSIEPIVIKRYHWYPIDILGYGLNISMIVFPRNSTLSIKLVDARINETQITVISGNPGINEVFKELFKPLLIAVILSAIILLTLFVKYRKTVSYR